jgi:hypothetical protein
MAAPTHVPTSTIEVFEANLTAVLDAAKNELDVKKRETKAARALVRQAARRRRRQHIRKTAASVAATAPRAVFYALALAGITIAAVALVLLAIGSTAAAITLFTVAGAAWGMGAVVRR